MKASWKGLLFSFAITSSGIEDVELLGVDDVGEFRESFPMQTPEEAFRAHEDECIECLQDWAEREAADSYEPSGSEDREP